MSHHGGHGYPKTKAIRERKRKEAEERQKLYDALSTQEKMERAGKKELAKLSRKAGK